MNWSALTVTGIPPQTHENVLSRPRLLSVLDTVLKFRLFLVIAPAGYGKTALVCDWIEKRSVNSCWCSLTSVDQDSHRFFAHFIRALQEVVPAFGPESQAMLESLLRAHSTVEQLVTTVVTELADHLHRDLVIVLEDFHTVDEQEEINQFVSSFVQQARPQWHVILTSRTLLGLTDLDLLLARGHVSGLGSEELAFQPQEIQSLAEKRFGHRLSNEQAVRLTEITEGWITGVLLSANLHHWHDEKQLRTLRSSGIDVYSYFARQILDKQDPELQDFLLRTSFMEEFDAEFCSTVLGNGHRTIRGNLQNLLDQVRQNNLFVSYTGHNGSKIRYHSLFREFLRDQFLRHDPQEVWVVTRKLTEVYVASAQWERVHELLTRLDDVSAQIEFIEQYGQRMLRAGHMQLLIRWINALPSGVRLDRVDVMATYGASLVLTGDTDFGVSVLNQVEGLLRTQENPALLIRVLANRSSALRYSGNYAQALADTEEALQLAGTLNTLEGQPDLEDSVALCMRLKGLVQYMMGTPEHLIWLNKALDAYRVLKNEQDLAVVTMEIGLAHMTAGNHRQALAHFRSVIETWRRLHNVAGLANVLNNLGTLHYMRGDYQAATKTLVEGLHAAQRSGYMRMEAFILASLADIMNDVGLTEAASELYSRSAAQADAVHERFLELYNKLAQAIISSSVQEWKTAYVNLVSVGQIVQQKDSIYEWSLYRLAMGRFYLAQGSPEKAMAPLLDAITRFQELERFVDLAVTQLFLAIAQSAEDLTTARATLVEAISIASRFAHIHSLVAVGVREKEKLLPILDGHEEELLFDFFSAQMDNFETAAVSLRPTLRRMLVDEITIENMRGADLVARGLGPTEVWTHGNLVTNADWTVQAARDLLFCLMAHPDGLRKEEIGALFWPECTSSQLRTRFKNTIYRMRNALPQDTILFVDGIYKFNRHLDYDYDVKQFLERAQEAPQVMDADQRVKLLREAFELYRGPYLASVDAMWAIPIREQIRQVFTEVALKLATLYLELDQAQEALNCCRRVLAEEPWQEDAHRLAMRVHAAMGNRGEIVAQYEECKVVMQEEVAAEPSEQTIELYRSLMDKIF